MPRALASAPARAIAASLESNGDTGDRAAGLGRLFLPALQQSEQRLGVRLELLHRVTRDQRVIRFQSREGSAQVTGLRHGTLRRLFPATKVPCPRRSPHSIFNRRRPRRITHGAERLLASAMTTPPRRSSRWASRVGWSPASFPGSSPFRKIVGRPRPQGKPDSPSQPDDHGDPFTSKLPPPPK